MVYQNLDDKRLDGLNFGENVSKQENMQDKNVCAQYWSKKQGVQYKEGWWVNEYAISVLDHKQIVDKIVSYQQQLAVDTE